MSRLRPLIAAIAIFAGCTPGPTATHTYKSVQGLHLKADVYHPGGSTPVPVLVWIHGGGLIAGSRDMTSYPPQRQQVKRYLDEGFAVVAIDYRLAPETKLDNILQDVRDAVRWVRAKAGLLEVDPERVALVGHSAGAFLAMLAGATEKPRAVVSLSGYGEITGEWYTKPALHYTAMPPVSADEARRSIGGQPIATSPFPSERFRFYVYCRQQGLWPNEVTGFDPGMNPEQFERFSVSRLATASFPPTLLLHGDTDHDVPLMQSKLIAERLKQLGVTHRLLVLEGKGHNFDEEILVDSAVSAAFNDVTFFLRTHLLR